MMQVLPESIRWRLTLLNVGVLIATIVALGGLFLLQLDNALVGIAAENLRDQARPLQVVQERRPPPEAEPRAEAPPPFNLARTGNFMVRALSGPDTGVDVYDPTGQVIASSDTAEETQRPEDWPTPDQDSVGRALSGAEQQTVIRQEKRRTLVLLLPICGGD